MLEHKNLVAPMMATWLFLSMSAFTQEITIEDDKSVVFDGSPDLPDGIAFQQFLLLTKGHMLEPDRVGELAILASALGHAHDVNGDYEYLRPRLEEVDKRRRSLDVARTDRAHAILCTDNRASRSQADSHRAMNALDDTVIEEARIQLETYMRNLSASEQQSFLEYLQKIKKSTTYERIDSRLANPHVAAAVENHCTFLNSARLANGSNQ